MSDDSIPISLAVASERSGIPHDRLKLAVQLGILTLDARGKTTLEVVQTMPFGQLEEATTALGITQDLEPQSVAARNLIGKMRSLAEMMPILADQDRYILDARLSAVAQRAQQDEGATDAHPQLALKARATAVAPLRVPQRLDDGHVRPFSGYKRPRASTHARSEAPAPISDQARQIHKDRKLRHELLRDKILREWDGRNMQAATLYVVWCVAHELEPFTGKRKRYVNWSEQYAVLSRYLDWLEEATAQRQYHEVRKKAAGMSFQALVSSVVDEQYWPRLGIADIREAQRLRDEIVRLEQNRRS